MTRRSAFHVGTPTATESQQPRQRALTLIHVEVDYVDEPLPRGRSCETWARARGWASED